MTLDVYEDVKILVVPFCFVASARCSAKKGMYECLRDDGAALLLELCTSAGSMSFLNCRMLMVQGAVHSSHHGTEAGRLQEPPWSTTKAALPPFHDGNGQEEVRKREMSCMNVH